MLLYNILVRSAKMYPNNQAILFRDSVFTYAQLISEVNKVASSLATLGVKQGSRVAVLLHNVPELTITYYAATSLGAVLVPANPLLKPQELAHIWGDSATELVVTHTSLVETVKATQQLVGGLRTIVTVEPPEEKTDTVCFADLVTGGTDIAPDLSGLDDQQPAVCIYTSGTTGRPKGALLSHKNVTANADQVCRRLQFTSHDRFLCVLPLFHSFAETVCQNTPLMVGASTSLVESFHPAHILDLIEQQHITVFPAVPAMFTALLQFAGDRPYDFSSVHVAVSGGAPAPVPLITAFEKRFGCIMIEGDGPSECSPVTSVNPIDGVRKPGTIGIPLPDVEMRIFDETDQEVPVGEVGEIVVRGENVMLGYHNLPEETAEAMRSGWYHTGDLGRVDEDGYFTIVDRKKDMLIVSGINVYPREIEEVLHTHPDVADVAVIGTSDALRGEQTMAVVVRRPDATVTARDLIRFCRERLANYKVPRKVVFRDEMPRSDTGKVLKRLLRKEMDMESGAISHTPNDKQGEA